MDLNEKKGEVLSVLGKVEEALAECIKRVDSRSWSPQELDLKNKFLSRIEELRSEQQHLRFQLKQLEAAITSPVTQSISKILSFSFFLSFFIFIFFKKSN